MTSWKCVHYKTSEYIEVWF